MNNSEYIIYKLITIQLLVFNNMYKAHNARNNTLKNSISL